MADRFKASWTRVKRYVIPNPVDSQRNQPLPEQVRYITKSALDEMMPLGIIRDISGFRIRQYREQGHLRERPKPRRPAWLSEEDYEQLRRQVMAQPYDLSTAL